MPTVANQSSMSIMNGITPALDADGCIPAVGFKVRTQSKSAAYTCTRADSGSYFLNTAAVTYTLPAVADSTGCEYWFAPGADFSCTVAAVTSTMATFNDTTANSIALDQAGLMLGSMIHVVCTGTKWIAEGEVGNILVVFTVAT